MEINIPFDTYMDHYFDFPGQWETPSKCGLKVARRKDGKTIVIATELYRQNPGTPVTEFVAPLATMVMRHLGEQPDNFLFIEHTPDLKSKLSFYGETFDRVECDWNGEKFINPRWIRLTKEEVDVLIEE